MYLSGLKKVIKKLINYSKEQLVVLVQYELSPSVIPLDETLYLNEILVVYL